MMYTKRYARAGFTLMELMIAITILGIIMAIAIPNYMAYKRKAMKRATKSTLQVFEGAILMYQEDIGQFPTRLRDLLLRPREERLAKKWEGPYLKRKKIPIDPWDRKYQYKVTPGGPNPYELYSYGPKGKGSPKVEWLSVWDD